MPVSLNLTGQIHHVQAVVLETDWLRTCVLPEVGAKIYDLIWKLAGRNLLWHNPRILPQTYSIDGNFDNYWCGGWDDGFPTCDPCEYRGELYPGLGELRSLKKAVPVADDKPAEPATGDRPFAAPYFWAAFVLIGDPE